MATEPATHEAPAPHRRAVDPARGAATSSAPPGTDPARVREQSRQLILAWQQTAGNSAVTQALATARPATPRRTVAAPATERLLTPNRMPANGEAVITESETGTGGTTGTDGTVAADRAAPRGTPNGTGPTDGVASNGATLSNRLAPGAAPGAASATLGTAGAALGAVTAALGVRLADRLTATEAGSLTERLTGGSTLAAGLTVHGDATDAGGAALGAPLPGALAVSAGGTLSDDLVAAETAPASEGPGSITGALPATGAVTAPPNRPAVTDAPPAPEILRPEIERPPAPPTPAAPAPAPPPPATPLPQGFAEKRPRARRARPAKPADGAPARPPGGAPARPLGGGRGGGAPGAAAPASLGDASLDAWKSAASGAIDATKAGELPKEGAAEVDAKAQEIDSARKGEKPHYGVDAKAVQPPMPAEPAKESTLDTGPADQALAAVKAVGERRLPDQAFSPVGAPPPYPGLNPRDFVPARKLKAIADLEAKLAVKDLSPTDRASLTKQLENAKADVAAIEKAAAEGTPAQPPPTVVDEGPASLEPLPPAQVDVLGDAIARAMGMVDPRTTAITDKAMALMKGTGVAPVLALARKEEVTVRSELERELQGIAEAAGVNAEQLKAKVIEQKELVAQEKEAADAKVQAAGVTATKQVEQRVTQESKEIAGAKAAVDAENEAKQSAVAGPPDTEAIESKRDEYLGKVKDVAAIAHAAARAAAQTRADDLGRAAGEHKGTVKQAADAQAAAIRRHWAEDPDPNKGMVEARPTVSWGNTRSAAVDSEMRKLQTAATAQTTAIDEAVNSAADSAKEQIRDWAARQEGGERSWWERLRDKINDWFDQASADNEAWARQRNAESRDKMAGDLTTLTACKEAQNAGNQQAMAAELAKLDGEQRALAVKFLQGGMSSIEFVAESTMSRIAARRAPELAKNMEEEAIVSWGWEDLGVLAQKSNPNFQPLVLANKVKGGVEGWGTDEAQVYAGIGGAKSAVERAALSKCYQATFGASMEDDVAGDMEDHELERAKALMEGKSAEADAAAIKEAVDGIGTDEDAIKQALRGKTPEEVEAIRAEYKRVYGVELAADLEDDLSGAELDTSLALAAGDVDAADAAELEEAMEGVGTDEEKLRKVYERIREEEAATAKREGLTPAELRQRIQERNNRVKAKYNAKYGDLETNMTAELADVDEGAIGRLKEQGSPLVDNADVKLMQALHSGDPTQIDAMRALREHEGVYASDDEIEKIARNQHKQADLTVNLDLAAEQARIKAMWESGDLTPEEFKAAQGAWKEKYDERDDAIKTKAQENMGELKGAYAEATGGTQTFDQLVVEETAGYSQLELQDLVAAGGALSPEDEIYYSVAGAGTDEDKLKEILKGRTPAEIQKMREKYEAKRGKGSFDSDIIGDLSGREDLDVGHTLKYGDPESFGKQLAEAKTPEERQKILDAMRTVLSERKAFEEAGSIGSLWSATGDPLNSAAQMEQSLMRAEEYDAALAAAQAEGVDLSAPNPDLEAAKAKFEMNYAGAMEAQEQVRKQIDAYTDVAAQVGAVVVGLAVTVLTAGAAGPAALAAAAAWGAAASAAASMAIKLQLKGAAYSWEDAGVDVAVGVVDAGVSALTAGMGKGIMDALENAIRRQVAMQLAKEGADEFTESAFRALVKGAMSEAIENGVQGMPSAALAAALSDDTWKSSDPFGAIVKATGTAGAMGASVGVGLHGAGEGAGAVSKALKGGNVPAGAVDAPSTGVDAPANAVDAPSTGPAKAPEPVDLDLPPEADPAQVVPKAVQDAQAPDAAPKSPRSLDAGDEIDLDDPANAHLVEEIDGVDPRQPHVGDDGLIDLDDPRNQWMLEDKFAGRLPDALASDPAASRDFFESFVASKPGLEAALLRNPVTGEHIIVQGSPTSVDIRSGRGVWEGLIPPEKRGVGRWGMVAHSHPVDPLTGVTPDWARVPSGSSGDFAWSVYEVQVTGAPVTQDIHITTETGPAVTRYGYDPTSPEPYSIDMPTADGGREVHRFPTIDDYHDWYKGRFSGDMGEVPADFPGKKRADAASSAAGTAPAGVGTAPGTAGGSSMAIDANPTRDVPAGPGPGPAPKAPGGAPGTPGVPKAADTTPAPSGSTADRLRDLEDRIDALKDTPAPHGDLVDVLDTLDPNDAASLRRLEELEERVAFWESEGSGPAPEGLFEATAAAEAARRGALTVEAERIEANKVRGSTGEVEVMEAVLAGQMIPELGSAATLLGSQVYVRIGPYWRIIDHLVRLPNGQLVALEVKTGGAVRSRAQREFDDAMAAQGGTIVGTGAPGMNGPVGPIPTVVLKR